MNPVLFFAIFSLIFRLKIVSLNGDLIFASIVFFFHLVIFLLCAWGVDSKYASSFFGKRNS